MAIPGLDDLIASGLRGKRVLVRADLNVPMAHGSITDDTRLRASLPTLQRLREAGARVVVTSHLGRPKGDRKAEFSLRPVSKALADLLDAPVAFCEENVGRKPLEAIAELTEGQIIVLENLRFDPGEEQNAPAFVRSLAELADAYVNDAFGTAHRAHASTAGVARQIPHVAAGDLLTAEIEHLRAVREPARPLLVVLGGAKVSDKISVLDALAPHADTLAIGGAMAYTFLAARGVAVGNSLIEPTAFEDAKRVEALAAEAGNKLLLPSDHIIAQEISAESPTRIVEEIPKGWMGVDIGPETAERYKNEARQAQTVFWNGPMGIFEIEPFATGTRSVAQGLASSNGLTVVGGGDSLSAINGLGLGDEIDHLSTGGGAALEFVQGLELPGVAELER